MGDGELLSNADDVKIPLGSGLPVGNMVSSDFYVWFVRYGF